jgi:hypothetical protein
MPMSSSLYVALSHKATRTYLTWALLLFVPVFSFGVAQSFPTLQGIVATDSDQLDVSSINQVALGLEAHGVKPVVIFIEGDIGRSVEEASTYLDDALVFYDMRQPSGALQKNLLALFVGTNPLPESADQRPLFIVYEDGLFPILQTAAGSKDVDTFIREDLMIPKLRDGNFTGAFTSVMESVAERLEASDSGHTTQSGSQPSSTQPLIPPTEPDVTMQPEAAQPNIGQPNVVERYWWLSIPVIALLGFLALRPRSQKPVEPGVVGSSTLSDRPIREDTATRLASVKQQLSDLTTRLETSLPSDSNQQQEMVVLSNYLEDQNPEALTVLRQNYNDAVEKFKTVTTQRTTYEGQTASASEQLPRYENLLYSANEVKAFTQSLNDQWQALNRELAAIPDKLSAMRGSLQQLKASYKQRPGFLTPDETFRPLEQDISEVEAVQRSNESLKALKMLNHVQANIALVGDSISRLMEADHHLDTFEAHLPSFQSQGFKLYKFAERIPDVRQDMAIALGLIKQGEYKVLDAQVDAVVEQTSEIVEGAKAFTDLHMANAEGLEQLRQLGETVKRRLEQSATTFAAFNEFAPSSWRDVQGNGTEAQNAANRAFELWEEASEANTLTSSQDFEHAKGLLGQVRSELERAQQLLNALDSRLADLQTARATAKEQLAFVEKDIAEFQTLLRRSDVDRDVGKLPEAKLSEAKSLVVKVKNELSQALPDWLVVMQYIQSADRAADEAMITVRSEQEAMERRRVRVQSEKVEAQSSLQRLQNYVQVHESDVTQETLSEAQQLQISYKEAEGREQSANRLSDELLGQTLEQAATLYDQVQQQADALFAQAEQEFNALERLRKDVATRVTSLQNRSGQVNSLIINAGLTPSPLQRQLYVITNSVPPLTSTQRSDLEQVLMNVQNLEAELSQLEKKAQKEVNDLRQYRMQQMEQNTSARDTYSWGGFGVASPPRDSSPWWGSSSSSSSSRSTGSSWSSRSSASSNLSSSSSSWSSSRLSSSSSSSSRASSWGGSGKKSGGGW